MGDVPQLTSTPANWPFWAGQLFDAHSAYSRMRASMKPEAKLQGFFHYLAVQARDRHAPEPRRAPPPPPGAAVHLVLAVDDAERELSAEVRPELVDRDGKRSLQLSCRLTDAADFPPAPAACRAFILTPGVVQRLCGPEAARGGEAMRRALLDLFAGRGRPDPFETARILAAVPELDGKVDDTGLCRFRAVELPEQAGAVEALPEQTAVVVVIDRPGHA